MSASPSRFERLSASDHSLPDGVVTDLLSPLLLVYLDHVRENVRRVLQHAHGDPDRWRPHVKTVKIPEVLAELVRAGIRNFKCATTREARVLLDVLERQEIRGGDVLLAHPVVGPALVQLGNLARAHPESRLSVLCEDPAALDAIPTGIGVFVDVNPGMNRTGLPADRQRSIAEVAGPAGARFRGVHFYEGHLAGLDLATRRERAFAAYDRLLGIVEGLESQHITVGEIITSGTPTFRQALDYPGFDGHPRHRVSPGTVVYHDHRSEQEIADLDLVPAAVVFTRIVSHPADDVATCDAGSKSLAAEAGDPCAYVLHHPQAVVLRPSEEHLPLRFERGPLPARGSPLLLVPRHVCPTVNLAEEAVLIENGAIRSIVPVSARAHDTRT